MAITIPDPKLVRVAHDFDQKPGAAGVALTEPTFLAVSRTGSRPDGGAIFVPVTGANRAGYVGIGLTNGTSVGAGITALKNTVIAGFAGLEPGRQVFIGDDGALTHTPPAAAAGEVVMPIGIGFTTTLLMLY